MTGVKFVLILIYFFKWNEAVIVNQHVSRVIDIKTHIVKAVNAIAFKNKGSSAVNSYDFVVDPGSESPFHKVFNEYHEELETNLNAEYHTFKVLLDKTVNPNDTYKITVELAYVGSVVPYYKTRKQSQNEVLMYRGNVHFYSRYETHLLRTTYVCNSDSDIELTLAAHSQKGNQIVYSYSKIKPYSMENLNAIFQNVDPILVVTDLLRTIDVSHFGKIFVEDTVALEHRGNVQIFLYKYYLWLLPN